MKARACVQSRAAVEEARKVLVRILGQEKADGLLPVFDGKTWSWPSINALQELDLRGEPHHVCFCIS